MTKQNEMRWNEGLTGQALQIAQTTNSPVWVAAGPGTGKTFALMRRLAKLLEVDMVAPDRILLCTFTRTAANDLARAIADLGIQGTDGVKAQTVHAFCFSMLCRQEVLKATARVPRPLLKCEERFLIEDLSYADLGGIRECKKKLKAFSAAWARLQHEQPGWPSNRADQIFQTTLHSWLLFHHAMLIGELVPEGLKYIRLNSGSPYRAAFDHVLVDEYQDLNRAEQQFVEFLANNGSLVVIGDEDQSIYSFKHAHPEGIAEFPQTHPTTEKAQLDECRRCPRRVVEMANSLIANNTTRSNRLLRPFPGNPDGEVFSVQWLNMQKEAEGVARFIKGRVEAGSVLPGKVLVLAPRREFGYLVRDELQSLEVSAHSFFSEELLDGDPKDANECHAQRALALLILLANPNDCVALRCWCGFGSNNLNTSAWAKLRAHCEQIGRTPWQVLEQLETGNLRIAYTTPLIERFRTLTVELTRLRAFKSADLVAALFPDDHEWARPFAELKKYIKKDEFGAEELVDVVRHHITQPELPTNVDYVRVMSLHKSKGLTADLVVIVGCLEGLMPFIDQQSSRDEQMRSLEEQRRLFYVAITRTQGTLVLSSITSLQTKLAHSMRAQVGRAREGHSATITSRFIAELGRECPASITGPDFLQATIK